jgi:hypothetical protein
MKAGRREKENSAAEDNAYVWSEENSELKFSI